MKKEYKVIKKNNSKLYKDVPYITKKEFKKQDNANVVGMTKLKKYKDDNYDLLSFEGSEYIVKEKYYGMKKGYVFVGNNNFILIKKHIPFLFLFLLFLLILLSIFFLNPKDNPKVDDQTPKQEIVIPKEEVEEDIPEIPDSTQKETGSIVINKVELKHTISFNSNGAEGSMNNIECTNCKKLKLSKNEFQKQGHTFIGWSTTEEGEVAYKDEEIITNLSSKQNEKITLYAKWEVNKYDVVFNDYDGSLIKKYILPYNSKIEIPESPTRKGYTFVGWDSELDLVTDNIIVSALYELNTYTISYELNGGSLMNSFDNYNTDMESFVISNPIKDGYTFIGWTDNQNSKPIKDYEIEKGSVGDLKLEANYKPNSYFISFDTNGGKEKYKNKEVLFDSSVGKLPIPSKDGYTFISWTNDKGETIDENTIYKLTENLTIYANWKSVDYNISYELNGGTLSDAPINYNVESDTFIIFNPTKEGYIFTGWTTQGNEELIREFKVEKGTIGNIDLKANYVPIYYTITYNSNGAEGSMKNSKYYYDKESTLRKNTFTYVGKNFKGWSTSEKGEVIYQDEESILNLSNENEANINLYAVWETIKLNVKYYDWEKTLLDEQIIDYGSVMTPPPAPLRDGYTFVGWDFKDDIITSNKEIYTLYERNTYTIEYDLNTGSNKDLKEIKFHVESDDITLPTPTRKGYTFIGWTGFNGKIPQLNITIPRGSVLDRLYKANWSANTYIVSLNPNGGKVAIPFLDTVYNSTYGIIPTPDRLGYTFKGWYYGSNKITEDTVLTDAKNHELVASWEIIDYDIIYNLNGGTLSNQPTKYNVETDTFTLPEPTKKGYTFVGWTSSDITIPKVSVTIPKGSTGNKEYTANWKTIKYSISYDLDGGTISNQKTEYNIETKTFTLPIPSKIGYTFIGWEGTGLNSATKNVTVNAGSVGNRSYTAKWSKNFYTVNYFVNSNLWATRSVGYNDPIENLNAQSALDIYHTFHGWNGWVNNMPSNNVNLYASITESYCSLTTGHGEYGNASALLSVFQAAGWTGNIINAPSAPKYYMVKTDYNLTRAQAEMQKNYIASHTNYKNYNFPYLYWVAVDCTNGYSEAWTRSLGQSSFN